MFPTLRCDILLKSSDFSEMSISVFLGEVKKMQCNNCPTNFGLERALSLIHSSNSEIPTREST